MIKKKCLILFPIVLILIIMMSVSVSAVWWNADYPNKACLNVTNAGTDILLANTTITANQIDFSGLTGATWSQMSLVYNDVDEIGRINTSVITSEVTNITFRLQANISGSGSDAKYCLYYGYAGTAIDSYESIFNKFLMREIKYGYDFDETSGLTASSTFESNDLIFANMSSDTSNWKGSNIGTPNAFGYYTGGSAMRFKSDDGSGEGSYGNFTVGIPLNLTKNLTFSGWVNKTELVLGKNDAFLGDKKYKFNRVGFVNANLELKLYYANDETSPYCLINGDWTGYDEILTHWTLTWDTTNGIWDVYIDGAYNSQDATCTPTLTFSQLNSHGTSLEHYTSTWDDISFSNTYIKNAGEAQQIYEGRGYPHLTPTVTLGAEEAGADTTLPTWSAISANFSTNTSGESLNFTATIGDETLLGNYTFSHNLTGSWVNETLVSIGGTTAIASSEVLNHLTYGGYGCGLFYIEDGESNQNDTDMLCFSTTNSILSFGASTPASNTINSTNLSISVPVNDADNGTTHCYLVVNGTTRNDSITHAANTNLLLKAGDLIDGYYNWQINCTDNTGVNVSNEIRAYTVSTTTPTIMDYNSTLLSTNNNLYHLNYSIFHGYLDAVNLSINLSGSVVYSNLSDTISTDTYWQIDLINFSAIGGDGTYGIEVCANVSKTNSPKIPNYNSNPRFEGLDFLDSETGLNVSTTFELLNLQGYAISLEGKNVEFQTSSDGEHMKFGGSLENLQEGQKIRLHYTSKEDMSLKNAHDLVGHFIVGNYYFDHTDLVNEGFTVESLQLNNNYIVIDFYKEDYGIADRLEWDPISGGLEQICDYKEVTVDTTPPVCALINVSHADIESNSTGTFELNILCSDSSGINTTKIGDHYRSFFTTTIDSDGAVPNEWQIFYPENNLSVSGDTISQSVLRAVGRNEDYWYETQSNLDNEINDTYTYSIHDGEYDMFSITWSNTTAAVFQIKAPVEVIAAKQSFPLNFNKMAKEEKIISGQEYKVWKNNGMLVKFYDLEQMLGKVNYTITMFQNLNYSGASTVGISKYYCNQSFIDNDFGAISPLDSTNCVFLDTVLTIQLQEERQLIRKNSSYLSRTYGIIDGKLGGITATNFSYIYYASTQLPVAKAYKIRYAIGDSKTNVSFNESGLAWSSTDNGDTFTQFAGTPDIFLNTRASGDEFQLGGCTWDNASNKFCDLSILTDAIGASTFPITNPTILTYQNFLNTNQTDHTGENLDLNGTYAGYMTMHIGIAIDPIGVGTVEHTLTLRDTEGNLSYTINSSFYSADDSDIHITFDTTNVTDGTYRMNITALDPDNVGETLSFLTPNNFTIDNTAPTVQLFSPANKTTTTIKDTGFNYNVTDTNSITNCTLFLNNNENVTNTTITKDALQNFSLNMEYGIWYWNVTCADVVGNVGYSGEYLLTINPVEEASSTGGGGSAGLLEGDDYCLEFSTMYETCYYLYDHQCYEGCPEGLVCNELTNVCGENVVDTVQDTVLSFWDKFKALIGRTFNIAPLMIGADQSIEGVNINGESPVDNFTDKIKSNPVRSFMVAAGLILLLWFAFTKGMITKISSFFVRIHWINLLILLLLVGVLIWIIRTYLF